MFVSLIFILALPWGVISDEAITTTTGPPPTTTPDPPGWEHFADLELEDDIDPETFLPKRPKVPAHDLSDKIYKPPISHTFGLHVCTFRPCDCFIGNCFAYCAYHWCFKDQNVANTRVRLNCDNTIDPWDCKNFEFYCSDYC